MQKSTLRTLEIHPTDAAVRHIRSGDEVCVFNDRGSLALNALVCDKVPPGVVAAHLDWAKLHPEGANVNVLTSERLTDMGNAPTFYSTLVEVKRV